MRWSGGIVTGSGTKKCLFGQNRYFTTGSFFVKESKKFEI